MSAVYEIFENVCSLAVPGMDCMGVYSKSVACFAIFFIYLSYLFLSSFHTSKVIILFNYCC